MVICHCHLKNVLEVAWHATARFTDDDDDDDEDEGYE